MADSTDLFLILAQIGVALAGFSGLVVVLRKETGPLSEVHKYRMRVLFGMSFGAVFLSITPDAIENLGVPSREAWRWSAAIFSAYSIIFLLQWQLSSRRIAKTSPEIFSRLVFSALTVGHTIVLLLQLSVVFGFWGDRSVGIFGIGLIWYLIHAAQQFVRMLFVPPRLDT